MRLLIPFSRQVFQAHELRSLGRIRLKHCLLKTLAFASLISTAACFDSFKSQGCKAGELDEEYLKAENVQTGQAALAYS